MPGGITSALQCTGRSGYIDAMSSRLAAYRALVTSVLSMHLAAQTSQSPPGPPSHTANTEWHSDFASAQKLAAEQHAPLFVVFRCER